MKLPSTLRLAAVQSAARQSIRTTVTPRLGRLPTPSAVLASSHPRASCIASTSYRHFATSTPCHGKTTTSFNLRSAAVSDKDDRVVRIIMFGKPGAGKGTLSSRLVNKYNLLSISTGDLLRKEIQNGTDIGKQAEQIMASGGLVPDELMLKIVTSTLDTLHDKHWILDGFPRTLRQGQLLESHLQSRGTPLTLVVNINVPDEVIIGRILDRWVHVPSGRVYNTSYNPPKVAGIDDVTGEPLARRADDDPETFTRRLQAFYNSTNPLLAYYDALSKQEVAKAENPHQHPHQLLLDRPDKLVVRTVTGNTSDAIWPDIDHIIMSMFPSLETRSEFRSAEQNDLAGVSAKGASAAASFK